MLHGDIDDVFDMRLTTLKGALIAWVSTALKTIEKESHFNAAWRDLLPEPGSWDDARANHEFGALFRTLRKPRDSAGAEAQREEGAVAPSGERGARCT